MSYLALSLASLSQCVVYTYMNMLAPHARYQFKPFFGSSHTWAMQQISSMGELPSALDVGSGSGIMGSFLKERAVPLVAAIEPDSDTRQHTSAIYDRMFSGLQELAGQEFALILLLDVLEHTPDPFDYFQQVVKLLTPGGKILLSVPNVAHWSVRLPLLFGQFNYTERGILDKTHLQFFTRKRFTSLLSSTGNLKIEQLSASIEPFEFLLPQVLWDNAVYRSAAKLRLGLACKLPGFFAYQHLAILSKRS